MRVGSRFRGVAGAAAIAATVSSMTACFFREPRVPLEELRSVPHVVGQTVAVARQQLESEGFLVRIVHEGATPSPEVTEEPPGKCADAQVVGQDPASDEDVRRAATVVLAVRGC